MRKLSPKQKLFVSEYLIDLNATQAALRAGYNAKTARSMGCENLTKPNIQACLQAEMSKRETRTEITQDRVLKEYARLAFLDPRKFFNKNGSLKSVVDLDDDTAACLAGMDVISRSTMEGDEPEQIKKIKIIDKKGALDSVAKHLGMFDRKETGEADKMIDVFRELAEKLPD